MTEPININQWSDGISSSPHIGMGLFRNIDVENFPGAAKVRAQATSLFDSPLSVTFTADATTDIMTISSGTLPVTGTAVTVSNSGGALPTGLSASTIYFILKLTDTTFKLCTTLGNAFINVGINITGNGSGTNTITSVDPGTINHIIINQRENVFLYIAQDSNGRVWYYNPSATPHRFYLVPGNTLTNASGNGLAIFYPSDNNSTWLFAFRNNAIDYMEAFSQTNLQTPSWVNAWKTMNTTTSQTNTHYAIRGSDNIIYFCDRRYIGTISEVSAAVFDPANAATYSYSNQALDLPLNEIAQHLEEQGTNLLIAGATWNRIYPWDRVSSSFNIPIEVPEINIQKLKNIGGTVYILAGTMGNIYSTTGTYVRFEKAIPAYVANNSGTLQATVVTWGGIAARDGALLFGAGVLTSGNSGVFLMDPNKTNRLTIDNQPASGSANVTALAVQTEFYIMGHASGATRVDTTRYAAYEGVIHTPFYRLATKTEKGTLSDMEAVIAKPASTGHIRVSYRANTSSAFTTLDTYTADGTSVSFSTDELGLIDLENVQFQIEMDGDMELVELRFKP